MLLILSFAFAVFTPLVSHAAEPSAFENLDTQTEKWLRFRGIYGCIYEKGFPQDTQAQVDEGHFFNSGATAIGYLNPDGKVSCNDSAFVDNSLSKIGFQNNAYAYCAAQPSSYRTEGPDTKTTDNVDGCVNGKGSYNNSESHPKIASQWLTGLQKQMPADYKRFMTDSGGQLEPSKYYMYYQSLLTFCGANQGEEYTGSKAQEDDVKSDERKVIVSLVDGKGDVTKYIYTLSRDRGDTVDDVYNEMGKESGDVKCVDMANRTTELASVTSSYVKSYNTQHPSAPQTALSTNGGGDGSDDVVCSAGALGWIVCPLMDFMADTVRAVADFLEGMLTYDPLIGSPQGDAIRAIWGTVLVIANVGLIIAFLAVVFSQATSVGISSYGIKKLLPRIIAAAILMNLSFYVCAIAVDIANILGVSVKGMIDAGMGVIAGNRTGSGQSGADFGQSMLVGISATLALGVAIGTGAIALLLPVLVSAVLAVLTAFLVLAAREVLITLLIILAPLAFLAWILPNTEAWFTKWRKLFTAMLLMFPMIMAIFYGSVLVSSLIMATRQNGTGAQGNMEDFMVNVLALGVLFVPLFSLPFIMKSAGGVLDRLGILVNNRNRGLVDRSRKKGQETFGNSAYQRSRAARKNETQARRSRDFYEAMAGEGKKGFRKRTLGRAGYTSLGTGMITKGGRLDARRTSDNISDMYRKQQTEATARSLAGLVEGGAFSQGSSYRLVGANGQELMAKTENHREMVPAVLAARGATLQVTDAAGKTHEYRGDDIKGAVMSKTAQMGDVPLTETILSRAAKLEAQNADPSLPNVDPKTLEDARSAAAGMREFISYNTGNYATKAPDYVKGAAGAFGDPKAAELVGWHAETSTRAAAYASQNAGAARSIGAALSEALGNDNLRGELTTGSVRSLIGNENTAIWQSMSPQEQQSVRDFLSTHQAPPPSGGGGTP